MSRPKPQTRIRKIRNHVERLAIELPETAEVLDALEALETAVERIERATEDL